MDILIPKPAKIRGYALHRLVAAHQDSKSALWVDEGSHVRIRPKDAVAPMYEPGVLLGFTLRACVSRSTRNKHTYLPLADWRGRRVWLDEKAAKNGFVVEAVHISGKMDSIDTHDGRNFTVDATEFVGLLRVTDPQAFAKCLVTGIGKVGRAFGMGLLLVQ